MYKNNKIHQFYSQVSTHFQVMYRYYPIPLQNSISKITLFLPNPFMQRFFINCLLLRGALCGTLNPISFFPQTGLEWFLFQDDIKTITLYIIITDRYMRSVSSSLGIQWLYYRIIQGLPKELHLQ